MYNCFRYIEPTEARVLGGIKAIVCCPCYYLCPRANKADEKDTFDSDRTRDSNGRQLYAAGGRGLWENNNGNKNADKTRNRRAQSRVDDDEDGVVPFLLPG